MSRRRGMFQKKSDFGRRGGSFNTACVSCNLSVLELGSDAIIMQKLLKIDTKDKVGDGFCSSQHSSVPGTLATSVIFMSSGKRDQFSESVGVWFFCILIIVYRIRFFKFNSGYWFDIILERNSGPR